MPKNPVHILLESEAATARLAKAFARNMRAGDVLLLSGGLAAGKTFFVRAAVEGLAPDAQVSSPTYTLANIYNGAVLHMDAYRLENTSDFYDLALEDEFAACVAFIEWGEKLAGEFDDYVLLDLAPKGEGARQATLSAHGPRGIALLAAALEGFSP